MRCLETETLLAGRHLDRPLIEEAKAKIAAEIAPISDIRSTADYRRRVSTNLLEEFLRACSHDAG